MIHKQTPNWIKITWKIIFLALCVFFGTLKTTNTVKHSLTYIYTAFSKPVKLPGIHEFSVMGLLDDRMIDYYDSTVQKKIPKQDWIKQEYWDKCTQSEQSKQQWFKVNINILINRMRQTSNDTHVLQWMHGCEGVEDDQGNLTFVRGMDMYNYDGEHLLHFDDEHGVWVAAADAAADTKRTWDEVTALKDYTKGYLKKEECMNCMKILLECSNEQLRNAPRPDVYMFSKKAKESSNVVLTCLATGFYPKDITLNIRRDGRVLTRDDGVMSSGVRPNHDETFQRRDYVEILRSDSATYTCEFILPTSTYTPKIIHPASDVHVGKTWDHRPPPGSPGPNIGLILGLVFGICVGVLLIVGVVIFFMYKKKMLWSWGCWSLSQPLGQRRTGRQSVAVFRNRINQRTGLEYQPTENKGQEDIDPVSDKKFLYTMQNQDSSLSLGSINSDIGDGRHDADDEAATNLKNGSCAVLLKES